MRGGYQGNNLEGCTIEQAEMALDCLAKLQAPVLNNSELATDAWLNAPPLITEQMFRDALPIYIQRYTPSEEHQAYLWKLSENIDAWRNDKRPPFAIFHGDYRLDNLIYTEERCVAVDWGGLQWASALRDVCYFLGNGLTIEERRQHEKQLVRLYMDKLMAYSGQELEWDHIWTEYRRQVGESHVHRGTLLTSSLTFYGVLQHITAVCRWARSVSVA
jgi:aminoglycoside phosphotransferase (APT) family kinase protein